MREYARRIHQQNEKKENWITNDDPLAIAEFIREEADELVEAIMEEKPAFPVGSELADILYLSLLLCHRLGFNPGDLLEFKLARNDLKYPTDLNSNGDYEGARELSQRLWDAMGGDESFYHAYLDEIDP